MDDNKTKDDTENDILLSPTSENLVNQDRVETWRTLITGSGVSSLLCLLSNSPAGGGWWPGSVMTDWRER